MANLETAIRIAVEAHAGQKDKDGEPYVLHPMRVMNGVEGEPARIAAVLHDVVEDTEVTLDALRAAGFSEEILEAVASLTHGPEESYAEYVSRCKGNAIARRVKLADLEDNARPSRAILRADRLEPDLERLRKYLLAYKYLTDMLTEEQYRAAMATR